VGFHEVQFPTDISYGSRGGPGFDTAIIETDGGAEQRVARLSQARRRYDAAYAIKTYAQLTALYEFYIKRMGPAYGFRFKDFLDFTTASDHRSAPSDTDQQLGIGDNSETQFQLLKKYTDGVVTRTRTITKPVDGTTVVSLDDVPQASGWSVDTTTGLITFTAAPGTDVVVKAGCEFDVPVRFGKEIDEVLSISIDNFEQGGIPGEIPLIELPVPDPVEGEYHYGGSLNTTMEEDTSLSGLSQRLQVFDPQTNNLKLLLPDEDNLALGGPWFFIVNESGSNAILIRDSDDTTTLYTLDADSSVEIWLGLAVGSTRTYYFI
jgi:uncharacterized protein (TIGR02217 family)